MSAEVPLALKAAAVKVPPPDDSFSPLARTELQAAHGAAVAGSRLLFSTGSWAQPCPGSALGVPAAQSCCRLLD
ncbi:hypothetical protein NDU88_004110 [Pleurodeles waltl]|uniref:Uncharacterized protein n=1 Tax=Pleurodeles waltl TaxID=8319 RepID=A0AAV7V0C9_PLEWA|nr:hypothetical protein NDU88_004110 [Pleurodeles waltl]